MSDLVAAAGAALVFVALLALAEAVGRHTKVDREAPRKFAHVSAGLVAASLPLVMSMSTVALLALAFVPFLLASRRFGLFPAIHAVERSTLGEVYFPLGIMAAAALVPRPAPYACGVLVMAVSDALAGVVGQRHGQRSYRPLGAHKTYVGSAVFFLSAWLLCVLTLIVVEGLKGSTLGASVAVAAIVTGIEGVLGGGADNLVLPTAGAALIAVAL